jgi:thiamine-monophosphate kinase
MPPQRQNEDSLIRKIAHRWRLVPHSVPGQSVVLGIGDDASLLRPKSGQEIILTCDWFLEGTHFLRDQHPPDSVGWKCLARALSDIAAMGGTPRCFLLSLALPQKLTGRWLDLFLGGLRRASRKFQCPLAGGDTTRQSKVLINVSIVGEVPTGHAVRRSGARAGDILYVTGRLGEAEVGLQIVRHGARPAQKRNPSTSKHLYPEPRLALGQWLSKRGLATAMMDISDGLSTDLPRLCAASAIGAQIEEAKIPQVHTSDLAIKYGRNPIQLALHGGDDYELLFTVPPQRAKLLPKRFQGVRLTAIGRITRERELLLLEKDGSASHLPSGGWDPFRKKP